MPLKINFNPKIIFYVLLAAIFLMLLFQVMCPRESEWEAAYNDLKDETEKKIEAKDLVIEGLQVDNEKLDDQIRTDNITIINLNADISKKDESLVSLKKEEDELATEEETLETVKAQRDNFKAQRDEWIGKFNLAQQTIDRLGVPKIVGYTDDGKEIFEYPIGSVTFSLNEKYVNQVKITGEWTYKYDAEHILRLKAEDVIGKQKKQINGLSFKVKAGKLVVVGGIALFVYGLLK